MSFDPFKIELPVTEIIPEVRYHLAKENTLIVNAPPGAGKSTLIPLAVMDEPWLNGRKILMLEPRRLAAKTIAMRMSSLLGEEVGQSVGYRIRFENKCSDDTRIEVLTEGILTRMIHSDNSLKDVGLVIFDEFHERSIYADVALALCREAQQTMRTDLRIMVMSATLNMPQLTKMLNAPVAISKGKLYPVDIIYTGQQDEMLLPELTARTIIKAANEKAGDILVFLPGQGEIRKCEALLKNKLPGFLIHPLYGQLPPNQQYSAIMPNKQGKRKVVLATSIAETSLTIEGISVVIDSGFGRTSRFDPRSGLSRLETIQISKDSADQRAGRAGRLGPGTCYRMWSKSTQENLTEYSTPEILEADLTDLVLDMAEWGIINIQQLTWLSPPPKGALTQASDTLHQLNALEKGRITEQGKKMHAVPCHPRIAHMLLMAEEDDKLELATDLAAVLEERDPLPKEAGIDINLRIEALRRYRKEKGEGKRLGKIEKIAKSYRKLFNVKEDNGTIDPYETGVLLAYAYPERIAYARPGNNSQFQLANGKYASFSHKDELSREPWMAVAQVDAREGMGKIFLASPLNPKDLAPLVKEQEVITWDTEDGELKATKDLRIGNIVLKSKPLPPPSDKFRTQAISDAIKKEGEELLDFNEELAQWQNRILSLRKWRPQDGWPDVSTSTLLITNEDWLKPHLNNIKSPEDLYDIDILTILQQNLEKQKSELLDQLAPSSIKVGSDLYNIHYLENGEFPILDIPFQKILDRKDNFRINEEKTPLTLHLLNPDNKDLFTTINFIEFWNEDYPKLKEKLKTEFPKVSWP